MVLIKCVRCTAIQRRYARSVILPPLKDVQQRPEVGNELRNQLCRLLTSAATQVRDLTAELLFIICKENGKQQIFFLLLVANDKLLVFSLANDKIHGLW